MDVNRSGELEVFVLVAELGSFSQAARKRGVSPSAVSKIIARLDLLAQVTTEKYRRAVIGYVQGLAGGTFLQFLPVR